MSMRESPRIRRLRTDLKAIEQLRAESSILDFVTPGTLPGGVPDSYIVKFQGRGLWRPQGSSEVVVGDYHEVSIGLGASYPRMMPELAWRTPIFHPNISGSGVVCLGGYGTHWVPSVNLDELCGMLWDMIRYANYDVESPYNRDAAHWAKVQRQFYLPIDNRPLRDKVAAGMVAPGNAGGEGDVEVTFMEAEVIEAEIIDDGERPPPAADILFID